MIRVTLPGSTSNIGPGFDTLGLAVNRFLTLTAQAQQKLEISIDGYGSSTIPRDEDNFVYRTIRDVFRMHGRDVGGFSLAVKNDIPDCGGLGLSGAMIAGGVVLANELGSLNLPMDAMLTIAAKIEGHPDNVTAALLGGLTVSSFDGTELHTRSLHVPGDLLLVVALPELRIVTKQARSTLPAEVPFTGAIRNVQNASSLVAAFSTGDFEALRWATRDHLHEHLRARLIGGFASVRQSALDAGAIAVTISGSGPSIIAFTLSGPDNIGHSMVDAFTRSRIAAAYAVMKIENNGATIERI